MLYTSRYLSKYQYVQCIIQRAKDIENGAKIDESCNLTESIEIAKWELRNKKFPYKIKLVIDENEYIVVDPAYCILPETF